MSGPSEGLTNLSSIHGPKATALGSLSIQSSALRSRVHIRVIDNVSHIGTGARGSSRLSPEHVNKSMLLLLVICVALAGTVIGAVGYLSGEGRSSDESPAPAQSGIEQ
jgi:hypothetical protein